MSSSAASPVQFADNDYCFACGSRNPLGLNLTFFEQDGAFCTLVQPLPHWQGFAGVMHGGLQATILDDLMSNHLFRSQRIWVVTADLNVRYRTPVPLDKLILFRSRLVRQSGRLWLLEAQCDLAGADPAAAALTVATGRFLEVPRPA